MKEAQNNLENVLSISQLDINADTSDGAKYQRRVTQYEYDQMQFHDPNCLYYIKDGLKVYLGDYELPDISDIIGQPKCFMTFDTERREYIVCKSLHVPHGRDVGIVVNRWNDPQKALDDMMVILHTSDKTVASIRLHEILVNYIKNVYGIETALLNILGAISKDGQNGHAVQHMTLKLQSLGLNEENNSRDLDDMAYNILKTEAAKNPDAKVVRHFLGLYSIFHKYNLFRDKKYNVPNPEDLNLSNEINDLLSYHVSMFPKGKLKL